MPSLSPAFLAAALLGPGPSLPTAVLPVLMAEVPVRPEASSPEPLTATPTPTPTAAPVSAPVTPTARPSAAQQAVLDRIRRLRDGDSRTFGTCSYRWDRWKLQDDGTRTTTYSCERPAIVDRTIGVNCTKLQINSYNPAPDRSGAADRSGKGESWAWGTWRLPQAGGEEAMVATLCANVLPAPAGVPAGTTARPR
jgi:hypothetical protein